MLCKKDPTPSISDDRQVTFNSKYFEAGRLRDLEYEEIEERYALATILHCETTSVAPGSRAFPDLWFFASSHSL